MHNNKFVIKVIKLPSNRYSSSILLALIMLLHVIFSSAGTVAAEETGSQRGVKGGEKKVVIIQSQEMDAYNEAVNGFREGCAKNNISITAIYNLRGLVDEGNKVVKTIMDSGQKPDLVLAVGILAAAVAKERFSDIPVLFCMVINYERFNLVGNNITGISSEVSTEDLIAIIKELFGTQKKNMGVIYDPLKSIDFVSRAESVVKKYGCNLVKKEISSEKEVQAALEAIVDKIDCLGIIPDGTVVTKNSLSTIINVSLKHRIPTVCTSSAIVKAGALISISPDYKNMGLQAAQMAVTLLNNPSMISLGVKMPDKLKIAVNEKTARIIGLDLAMLKKRSDVVWYK